MKKNHPKIQKILFSLLFLAFITAITGVYAQETANSTATVITSVGPNQHQIEPSVKPTSRFLGIYDYEISSVGHFGKDSSYYRLLDALGEPSNWPIPYAGNHIDKDYFYFDSSVKGRISDKLRVSIDWVKKPYSRMQNSWDSYYSADEFSIANFYQFAKSSELEIGIRRKEYSSGFYNPLWSPQYQEESILQKQFGNYNKDQNQFGSGYWVNFTFSESLYKIVTKVSYDQISYDYYSLNSILDPAVWEKPYLGNYVYDYYNLQNSLFIYPSKNVSFEIFYQNIPNYNILPYWEANYSYQKYYFKTVSAKHLLNIIIKTNPGSLLIFLGIRTKKAFMMTCATTLIMNIGLELHSVHKLPLRGEEI